MPVNVTMQMRCTSKNLMSGGIPQGGTVPVDNINAQFQLVPPADPTTAPSNVNLNMTYPIANDQIQIGNYYDVMLIDSTSPPATLGVKR